MRAPRAAPARPAGLLPQEGRDRDGLLPQPRETSREVPGQDTLHKGTSIQVREHLAVFPADISWSCDPCHYLGTV